MGESTGSVALAFASDHFKGPTQKRIDLSPQTENENDLRRFSPGSVFIFFVLFFHGMVIICCVIPTATAASPTTAGANWIARRGSVWLKEADWSGHLCSVANTIDCSPVCCLLM